MLCLSQKDIFALYLDDTVRFAGILCPQAGDILKVPTLSYVSYPYFKSHAVWALYLLHAENEIEKNVKG